MNTSELGYVRRMSELNGYAIEKGDADPRGYAVVDSSGTPIGRVVDLLIDTNAMKVRQLLIEVTDAADTAEGHRTIDVTDVDIREGTRQVYARATLAAFDEQRRTDFAGTTAATEDAETLTRSEEELRIGKREVSRGEVRVAKHVETDHVSEPVTRRREEVVIERRPVEASARAADISEQEVRIPLMEEEVVVDKRPVVKEELVIGKRVVEERDVVHEEVRREEFDIDRDGTPGDSSSDARNRRRP